MRHGRSGADGEGRRTILLVEDDDVVRDLAGSVLEEAGFEVLSARTALKAEEVFSESGDSIDLLLTDLVLPGGNGRDLAETFRALHPGLEVLYMSGYGTQTLPREIAPEPGSAFIPKPFKLKDLVARVKEILRDRHE